MCRPDIPEKWVAQLSAAASQVGNAALASTVSSCLCLFGVATEGPSLRAEVSATRVTDDKKYQRISERASGSSGPICGLEVFIGNSGTSPALIIDLRPDALGRLSPSKLWATLDVCFASTYQVSSTK